MPGLLRESAHYAEALAIGKKPLRAAQAKYALHWGKTNMNELVEKLTKGSHSIVAERSATSDELRQQIEREFVLLKFPNTEGGTELGSQLDLQQSRLDGADFESGTGQVHLVGNLTLNYDKVQLVADIDLASLEGTGHLVLIEEESVVTKAKSSAGKKAAKKKAAKKKATRKKSAKKKTAKK